MTLRVRFWIIIASTVFISFLMFISSQNTKHKLIRLTAENSSLEHQVTLITSFRAATRQALLDLTELLYDQSTQNITDITKDFTKADAYLGELENFSMKSDESTSSYSEIKNSYVKFHEDIIKLVKQRQYAQSKTTMQSRSLAAAYFEKEMLVRVNKYLSNLNSKLSEGNSQYQDINSKMAETIPVLAILLSVFVIIGLSFTSRSMLIRIDRLNNYIKSFALGLEKYDEIHDESHDELSQVAKSFKDLTNRIRSSEEVIRKKQIEIVMASKLASLGEMSAGVTGVPKIRRFVT